MDAKRGGENKWVGGERRGDRGGEWGAMSARRRRVPAARDGERETEYRESIERVSREYRERERESIKGGRRVPAAR